VVHRRGQVQAGETVLVLGAAGGVPSAAVQLCVAAGCTVIAVAGGAEKAAFCRALGAHHVIDHRQEDFVEGVVRRVGFGALDAIVDFVQGEPGKRARPLLAVEGRHILAGHAAGLIPIHPDEFYLQNWTLVGVCMGSGYGERLPAIEDEAHAGGGVGRGRTGRAGSCATLGEHGWSVAAPAGPEAKQRRRT